MSPEIWLGSDLSLVHFLQRHEQEPPAHLYARKDDEEDEDPFERMASSLIERYQSVGVVNIRGSLVNEESELNTWFGDLAYGTIQRSINQLLQDDSIQSIVLDIDTPGGDASGIETIGTFIQEASRIKPITAFASTALSAGYWIAASADKVYSSKLGQTGSIGAISTIFSQYERLRAGGIEPFVARSAPRKALGHPAEPMSDAAKQTIQAKVDAYGDFFIENVARNRPTLSYANAKTTWGTGDTFFGDKALSLGLIDGLQPSISHLISEQIMAHNRATTNEAPHMATKLILSELGAARISMGLDPETAVALTGELDPPPAPIPEPTPTPELEATTQATASDGLATYLKEEISNLKQENSTLKAELQAQAQLKADLNFQQATVAHLRPVAEAAVMRLAIGLGHRPMALESLPSDILAKTFSDLQAELMALPTGRQSAEPTQDVIEADPAVDTLAQHRLRLVPHAR